LTKRELLLHFDEIDEYSLTKAQPNQLMENHEISMVYKPTDVILTENGWIPMDFSKGVKPIVHRRGI